MAYQQEYYHNVKEIFKEVALRRGGYYDSDAQVARHTVWQQLNRHHIFRMFDRLKGKPSLSVCASAFTHCPFSLLPQG